MASYKILDFFGELGFKVDAKPLKELEKTLDKLEKQLKGFGSGGIDKANKDLKKQNELLQKLLGNKKKITDEQKKQNKLNDYLDQRRRKLRGQGRKQVESVSTGDRLLVPISDRLNRFKARKGNEESIVSAAIEKRQQKELKRELDILNIVHKQAKAKREAFGKEKIPPAKKYISTREAKRSSEVPKKQGTSSNAYYKQLFGSLTRTSGYKSSASAFAPLFEKENSKKKTSHEEAIVSSAISKRQDKEQKRELDILKVIQKQKQAKQQQNSIISNQYYKQMFGGMTQKSGYGSAKSSASAFAPIFEKEDAVMKRIKDNLASQAQLRKKNEKAEKATAAAAEKSAAIEKKKKDNMLQQYRLSSLLLKNTKRSNNMFTMMSTSTAHMLASVGSIYTIMAGMNSLKTSGQFFQDVTAGYELAFGDKGSKRIMESLAGFAKEVGVDEKGVLGEGRKFLTSAVPIMGEKTALESFEAFNVIGRAGGASKDEMNRAMVGFSQLQTGEYAQSQELRQQIAENMPVIVKELAGRMFPELSASEANKAFKRGMKENTLAVEDINKAIRAAGKDLRKTDAFAKMTQQLTAWESRFKNAITGHAGMLEAINKGSSKTEGAAGGLTEMFKTLTIIIDNNKGAWQSIGDFLNLFLNELQIGLLKFNILMLETFGGDKGLTFVDVMDYFILILKVATAILGVKFVLAIRGVMVKLGGFSAALFNPTQALSKAGGFGAALATGARMLIRFTGVVGVIYTAFEVISWAWKKFDMGSWFSKNNGNKTSNGSLYNKQDLNLNPVSPSAPSSITNPTTNTKSTSLTIDKVEINAPNAGSPQEIAPFVEDMFAGFMLRGT